MSYFRHLDQQIEHLLDIFSRDERWLILINADPDALASAMALKRIMVRRVLDVGIAHVNPVSRPDNLAMIRHLHIPAIRLTPAVAAQYNRFALVDSQPHHHPAFKGFAFSVIFDHHPVVPNEPAKAVFKDIQSDYGANSTLLTEYLYNLKIRPGKLLATALLYGIKTDTAGFERPFRDVDVRAFRYLTKFSNPLLLRKIVRSEFKRTWLSSFSEAFSRMQSVGKGLYCFMGQVENPDILVILADFFMRVHDTSWSCVAGLFEDRAVVVFRGDGLSREAGDMGRMAGELFGDLGSAGGHKGMARAEFDLAALHGQDPETFILGKIKHRRPSCPFPPHSKRIPPDSDCLPQDISGKNP